MGEMKCIYIGLSLDTEELKCTHINYRVNKSSFLIYNRLYIKNELLFYKDGRNQNVALKRNIRIQICRNFTFFFFLFFFVQLL